MANISKNYPSGSTDGQIYQVIKELSEEVLNSGANINTVLQLTPLINLGQNELQKRILDKSSKEVSKLEKIAIVIASVSIILSAIAIYFSFQSVKSSKRWENNQIELLEQIQENTRK